MNCIIVDDEFPSREELKYFVNEHSKINIEKEFDNSIEALKYLQENDINIVFLDINMPNINGITLAEIISKLNKDFIIIFITAYADFAVKAFEVKAFDYILKPYSEERIIKSLKEVESKVLQKDSQQNKSIYCNSIVLYQREKMYVISLEDILCLEACERETKVYTKKGIYISKNKISDIEKTLPESKFYRTHRSYIVNLEKIEEIIPWFNNTYNLKLKNIDLPIPVSRNNIKEFKKIMKI